MGAATGIVNHLTPGNLDKIPGLVWGGSKYSVKFFTHRVFVVRSAFAN